MRNIHQLKDDLTTEMRAHMATCPVCNPETKHLCPEGYRLMELIAQCLRGIEKVRKVFG